MTPSLQPESATVRKISKNRPSLLLSVRSSGLPKVQEFWPFQQTAGSLPSYSVIALHGEGVLRFQSVVITVALRRIDKSAEAENADAAAAARFSFVDRDLALLSFVYFCHTVCELEIKSGLPYYRTVPVSSTTVWAAICPSFSPTPGTERTCLVSQQVSDPTAVFSVSSRDKTGLHVTACLGYSTWVAERRKSASGEIFSKEKRWCFSQRALSGEMIIVLMSRSFSTKLPFAGFLVKIFAFEL